MPEYVPLAHLSCRACDKPVNVPIAARAGLIRRYGRILRPACRRTPKPTPRTETQNDPPDHAKNFRPGSGDGSLPRPDREWR